MDGYRIETDDYVESQALQDAKLKLHQAYASASIDVSYIQHNMCCDGLSAAICSKINTFRNTG